MTLKEIMKKNKIVVGVKHIKMHHRDLFTIKNMIEHLKNNETKLKPLGGRYYLIVVREGGLIFTFNVQNVGKLNKIVNWENYSLFDYVRDNKNINNKLWELV